MILIFLLILIVYVFYLTFCPIRHFVPFDVFSIQRFVPFGVFSNRHFVPFGLLFCNSTFFTFGVCYFDILLVNLNKCLIHGGMRHTSMALYFYGASKKTLQKPRVTFGNMLFKISYSLNYYLQLFC
jgi:hypothetical protein